MGDNPLAEYMGRKAGTMEDEAQARLRQAAIMLGAGIGATPIGGPAAPIAGGIGAIVQALMAGNIGGQGRQMQQGADMWANTGMPGRPEPQIPFAAPNLLKR